MERTVILGQNVNGEISADVLFAELVGSVPLGRSGRLLGKLGVANVDVELKTDVFAVPLGIPDTSFSTDSTEVVYGLDLFSASIVFHLGNR